MDQLASSKKSGKKSKQVDKNTTIWGECNQSTATNNAVVKHKQDNVCSRPNWPHPYSQAQFSPSVDQLTISGTGQNPQRDTRSRRSQIGHRYPTHVPRQITWPAVRQHGCCSKSCEAAASFTSDRLPQTGVLIFSPALETSKVKHRASHCLASSASAGKSPNVTTPCHISEMLRRIRREQLGVREPCGADGEARKQMGGVAGAETPQLAGGALRRDGEQGTPPIVSATSSNAQSAPVSSQVLYPDSGPPRIAPAGKSTALNMGREGPGTYGLSSGFTGETSGPANTKRAPSHPDADLRNRIRMAHKSKQGSEAKKASSELSWNGVKRKRPAEATGIPRWEPPLSQLSHLCFFMQKSLLIQCDDRFANDGPEQDGFTQMEDLPLSEGFHWESLPDSPSLAPLTGSPPPVQNTRPSESPTEPQSSLPRPDASEELPEEEENRRGTVAVKVEPNPAVENGAAADPSTAQTRKTTAVTVSPCARDGLSYLIHLLCKHLIIVYS